MIKCKGRNGWFLLNSHEVWIGATGALSGVTDKEGRQSYVELFSSSPFTQRAPLQFAGPARELCRLLRQLARELEAANRAAEAQNPIPRKEPKA